MDIKTEQLSSGDLYGNIISFGVVEGSPLATPNSVILPHRSPDGSCFALNYTEKGARSQDTTQLVCGS